MMLTKLFIVIVLFSGVVGYVAYKLGEAHGQAREFWRAKNERQIPPAKMPVSFPAADKPAEIADRHWVFPKAAPKKTPRPKRKSIFEK